MSFSMEKAYRVKSKSFGSKKSPGLLQTSCLPSTAVSCWAGAVSRSHWIPRTSWVRAKSSLGEGTPYSGQEPSRARKGLSPSAVPYPGVAIKKV